MCNARNTFQGKMDRVGTDLDFVFIYLYDIRIASSSMEEHLVYLQQLSVRVGLAAGQDVVKNSKIWTGNTPHKAFRGWGRIQGEDTTIYGFNNIIHRNAVEDAWSNRRVKPSAWLTNESSKLKNHNFEIIQDQK